jgi:NAD(P)-dependent dehydrogenase (short-subunit alcohol dehydrogenase family)
MTDRKAIASKTVLVTGASGGVGRGIALACGAAGWEVWIAARRHREATAVAEEVSAAGGRGQSIDCDVSNESSVRAALSHVASTSGGLDGIVHNATSGFSSHAGPVGEITLAQLEDHVGVASRGLYLLARHGRPLLAARRGSLVVMTSEAGFEGKRLLAAYAMVKAQQRALVAVLAREWGPSGARVNAVAPLASSPAMTRAFAADSAMEQRVMSRIPLGRLGDAENDIGVAVRFLLGDDARFVTGQTLMVDGGSCPTS